MNPRFLAIARDPRIVPGLHHACDEWCDYCPLTDRCLLFQCIREFRRQRRRPASAPAFRNVEEAMQFARDLASIDESSPGSRTSAATPGEDGPLWRAVLAAFLPDDDSLAGLALEYARRSREFINSDASIASPPVPKPTPTEVILRFHSRIYFKAMRALVGWRVTASGMADRAADANICAGQTLAYVDRSRGALAQFPDGDERRALDGLLDAIACGIEARFPDVLAFRRNRLVECHSQVAIGRDAPTPPRRRGGDPGAPTPPRRRGGDPRGVAAENRGRRLVEISPQRRRKDNQD